MAKTSRVSAALAFAATLFAAAASAAPAGPMFDVATRRAIVEQRLAYYDSAFPGIAFVLFEGGAGWRRDMEALGALLGDGAANLDYVTPLVPDADLLDVNLDRIGRFLRNNVVSSASFRVGQRAAAARPYLCLVALNPAVFASDPVTATRQMVTLSEDEFRKTHPSRLVDVRAHLRFAVDHEVFHCLESIFYGGLPLDGKPYSGEYRGFSREGSADGFALAMHLREHGGRTDYAGNIALLRALWLAAESPDSSTFETARAVYQAPIQRLAVLSPRRLVDFVVELRNSLVSSYDQYVERRNGSRESVSGGGSRTVAGQTPDGRGARYHFYLEQLFDDAPVRFAPPSPPLP